MSGDLISKTKLMEDIRNTITEMSGTMDWLNLINRQPVVKDNGWIPVSERLPEEEYDTVLAVTDRNHYCVAVYTTEHGFRTMDIDCAGNFVAWQPLPEPYKEVER